MADAIDWLSVLQKVFEKYGSQLHKNQVNQFTRFSPSYGIGTCTGSSARRKQLFSLGVYCVSGQEVCSKGSQEAGENRGQEASAKGVQKLPQH